MSADYRPFLSFGLKRPQHHYTLRCGTAPADSSPRPARVCRALSVQRTLWELSAFPCSVYVRTWTVNAKGPVPSRTAIRDRCERADGIPTARG